MRSAAAEAPHDWDDVLDPKWRDKILIRNPNPSDTMRAIFGAMIGRFYKDTGTPDKGYDWLRKLDANVHEYTADGTLLMQKLARREGLISLWDMPDVRLFKEQKEPAGCLQPAHFWNTSNHRWHRNHPGCTTRRRSATVL